MNEKYVSGEGRNKNGTRDIDRLASISIEGEHLRLVKESWDIASLQRRDASPRSSVSSPQRDAVFTRTDRHVISINMKSLKMRKIDNAR
jgi:hypothetical protein